MNGVAIAPGRVNLIGEHTDYNEGFVLPMTIQRSVRVAFASRSDGVVSARSELMNDAVAWTRGELDAAPVRRHWSDYVLGIHRVLADAGVRSGGVDLYIESDLAAESGLSSSAALLSALGHAFAGVAGIDIEPREMAKLCRRAENEHIGLASGIMDHLIVAVGRAGHAGLIDCRSLAVEYTPLPASAAIVVIDTGEPRTLASSAYNDRRAACERVARAAGVPALRDLDLADLARVERDVTSVDHRRARHIIRENARVRRAADAMKADDLGTLGRLFDESHESLRVDYEVSSDALDAVVAIARETEGCFGARMTGAGFGGCAIALVSAAQADSFIAGLDSVAASRLPAYRGSFRAEPADGARLVV